MKPIVFGTDGWRGVIADDFTFDRVVVVCEAIGEYFRQEGTAAQGIAVGYDNRFASAEFAALAVTVLTRQGIRVHVSQTSVPTPLVSYAIKAKGLGGGVMITASHNPPKYNGIKVKPWFAGSAFPEQTRPIAARANELLASLDADAMRRPGPDATLRTIEDFVPTYLQGVLNFVDVEAIRAAHPRLLVDPMYGSSIGVLDRALREAGCAVQLIHGEYNPSFGGMNPEPIPENLRPFFQAVPAAQVDGGIASDGDGDRIAAVAEDGSYVSSHHVFALLLMHLVEDRQQRGTVVKTVSTTTMIDQLAQQYDLPLIVTPIGFKHICQLMLEGDVLIGGEESGGIGVRGHIPERDATLAALLLVEMMAMRRTTLGGLLAQLRERTGLHAYDRIDLDLREKVSEAQATALRAAMPARLAGATVTDVTTQDGVKVWLEDGSWLLLRPSGTEPKLRVYAEGTSAGQVQALLGEGCALVSSAGIHLRNEE